MSIKRLPKSLEQRLAENTVRNEKTGCLEWTGAVTNIGYGKMALSGKTRSVHRVVYEYFIGPIPDGLVIRHQCHNKICLEPQHLTIGTQKDNVHDCMKAGRHTKGIKHGSSKLTDEKVVIIKRLLMTGMHIRKIAAVFGVSYFPIQQIRAGKAWKHIA